MPRASICKKLHARMYEIVRRVYEMLERLLMEVFHKWP